eukprot:gnl/MRDRNA2_/MRDRNA2_27065_c0_seq1.p1 gnl/MRDRNA2_/MRDRNA2_27065_c0~~gnl/MRDRNA2_/MRDRNA2_27065_c0_seq1.p1  ORF type:complete len:246 (+),score=50.85 gnl/MRDRNA2_/MRDRNA2_27065_c0_seq1:90-827(+)
MGLRVRACVHCSVAVLLLPICAEAGTNEVGKKFLEENKGKPGVITLPSGLQYKVLKKGTGNFHPAVNSPCSCHYAGTTPSLTPDAIDKKESEWSEFDSSYKRGQPTEFAPNQVIKGWTEAMQLMVEGDKWEMYIPSELGYGDGGSGEKIKGGDVLIFRMEILKIKGEKVKRKKVCNIDARDECEPWQTETYNEWSKKSQAEIEKSIKSMKNKAKYENNGKKKEQLMAKMNILKEISQAKKAKEEL